MGNTPREPSRAPFDDLDAYVALPRIAELALSPDGQRLVTSVATLSPDQTKYVTALWLVDPTGERSARRLTRSAKGEAGPAFLPDGSLLFTSGRPDPESKDDDELPMLWLLPAEGGEARVVARRPGGLGGVVVAREAPTFVVASDTFPTSTDFASDEAKRKGRKEKKVTAILHDSYPVRRWDHDLGPAMLRLFVCHGIDADPVELHDLAPDAGPALADAEYDLSSDGRTLVTTWNIAEVGAVRTTLVAIDTVTGERRSLADEEHFEYESPAISPDGTEVAAIRESRSTPTDPPRRTLVVVPLTGGPAREVAGDWDRWPQSPHWTPDGKGLVVVADHHGRGPVFRVDVGSGDVTRLTRDDAAYTNPVPSGAGQAGQANQFVYALRSSCLEAPAPVRLDALKADQDPHILPPPAPPPEPPGHLTEVTATADDGATVRGWLALPPTAAADRPAPLLLWVHGGPTGSWNAWSWRWNPWVMVTRGYAVLLPDPALSTGYGQDFIRRGWGRWGEAPYTDLIAITDATTARDDVDETRTAAMGGSFGGYMANWMAGNTDRFDAIVTHASLWALEQFWPTTDSAWYWEREMTTAMTANNSPHRHVDSITTPMLVIHGDKDYRVPISEALRLWRDLAAQSKASDRAPHEFPHKFLYFPDENHWVLSPQHAKVWYETVLAFLAHHVLGEPWQPPAILR